jgi:hypothetical protein
MHKTIIGLLAVLILGSNYMPGSEAFAQLTQPLDLQVEKQIDMSESGRIQEEVDRRPETTNFPNRNVRQQGNSVTLPSLTKPIREENPDNSIGPNSKFRYP